MNNSIVSHNLQHGLFLENLRNFVIVNASSIMHNNYGAGIRIYSGAGAKILMFFFNNSVYLLGGLRLFRSVIARYILTYDVTLLPGSQSQSSL